VQGPLQSHGVAGRVFPWASSAAILTRSYCTFAAISRCGTPAAGAPCRHLQSATSSKPSVAYGPAPACECAFGVHAIRTPSLVEIHNDYVGQFREHSRPRSAQCAVRSVLRAHVRQSLMPIRRGCVGARQRDSTRSHPLGATGTTRPK